MINLALLDIYRDLDPFAVTNFGGPQCSSGGIFHINTFSRDTRGCLCKVIATTDHGWDHVSASWPHRCPTWDEMETIKRLFFRPDETAMQLHVPEKDHVNFHPYTLHLWRPQGAVIPRPDTMLVGGWQDAS